MTYYILSYIVFIMNIIKVIQNPNMKEWFNVLDLDQIIDEFKGQANAMKKAKRIAKKNGVDKILIESNGEQKVLTISNT